MRYFVGVNVWRARETKLTRLNMPVSRIAAQQKIDRGENTFCGLIETCALLARCRFGTTITKSHRINHGIPCSSAGMVHNRWLGYPTTARLSKKGSAVNSYTDWNTFCELRFKIGCLSVN